MLGNLEVYFKSNQFTMTTANFFLTLEKSNPVILKKVQFSLKDWSCVWPKDDDWLYQKGIWPLCRTKPSWKYFSNNSPTTSSAKKGGNVPSG